MSDGIVDTAKDLAARAHEGQVRKSGNLPYFVHLESVARRLVEHGYDDEVTQASAYLHDVLEDCPLFVPEFLRRMPAPVVETVRALSEIKMDRAGNRLTKALRFAGYAARLAEKSDVTARALPISCADKIDNAESVVVAQAHGDQLLLRLTSRPGQQLSQLAHMRTLYDGAVSDGLLASYDGACRALAATIEVWLPGRAVSIAAEAHLGQYDRAGVAYIWHPLTLAMNTSDRDERIVSLLHDVVEDSEWTLEGLAAEGFSPRVVEAIAALTKQQGEDYAAFIERVARNPLASRVKLLDLAHNSALGRIPHPTDADRARVRKYEAAAIRLRAALASDH